MSEVASDTRGYLLEARPRAKSDAVGTADAVVNVANAWRADHQDILDQLSEYLDGSLSAAEAERMQQHLDGCERCQAFYRTLGTVVGATRELPLTSCQRKRGVGSSTTR